MATETVAVDRETGLIIKKIAIELARAEKLYPAWPSNLFEQVAIMAEESGEVVKAANDYKWKGSSISDVRTEAIQTAAMCIRMIKNLPKDGKKNG